ncbi:hypothetical protein NAF17_13375 [Mucilaginibacter sp. RB4R14]|uniref:hypothetical protein n=1 Tax=Mucilaginibacter aurantiaciroseus TaxID=2949308 RepID=UPI002091C487|nr:hypothetical protein [Mucilaginibacter aurantiaciroseus]MCO5936530.1 hypothetical protein [Mucilaginibacter aurantiaciroseus]
MEILLIGHLGFFFRLNKIMVFYLDDVLIEEGPKDDRYYDFIQTIMMAYKEGKHIVVISPRNVVKLISDGSVDETSKFYLKHYLARDKEALGWLTIFNVIIRVIPINEPESFSTEIETKTEIRSIKFSTLIDTASVQRTILLGENGNDSEVYALFAEYFRAHNKLESFKVVYKRQTGGGSTTVKEYKTLYEKAEEFCLCILDSDKSTPNSELGDTAKKVKEFHESASSTLPNAKCHYVILNALEVENLFPHEFYKSTYKSKEFNETHLRLEKLQKKCPDAIFYVDYKKGLRTFEKQMSHLLNDYWYGIIQESSLQTIWHNDNHFYIPGYGHNVLSNFVEYKADEIFEYLNVNPSLQKVWLDMGQTISSFILGRTVKRAI